jgi:hypothetical protein
VSTHLVSSISRLLIPYSRVYVVVCDLLPLGVRDGQYGWGLVTALRFLGVGVRHGGERPAEPYEDVDMYSQASVCAVQVK